MKTEDVLTISTIVFLLFLAVMGIFFVVGLIPYSTPQSKEAQDTTSSRSNRGNVYIFGVDIAKGEPRGGTVYVLSYAVNGVSIWKDFSTPETLKAFMDYLEHWYSVEFAGEDGPQLFDRTKEDTK
jgi:hypothetical protein